MDRMERIAAISALIVLVTIACTAGVGDAKKISDYTQAMKMEFASLQGMVDGKSPEGDYLIVSNIKVYLVDASVHSKNLATMFYDASGNAISFKDVKVGDHVYIYAGALSGTDVAAKEVFVLGGKLSDIQLKRFAYDKKLKSWRKERASK